MKTTILKCRGKTLEIGSKTLIMGILNVTPDSFSDGGRYNELDAAVEHAKIMVAEGADLIDVGGESTRPGSEYVSEEEELRRVIPIIEALQSEISIPISIDTYKAGVARKALEAGAHILNDVWGLKKDPLMAKVAAEFDSPIMIMHNRTDMNYKDLVEDVIQDLRESIDIAHKAGIRDEQIMLDPGIGFAKTYEDNLKLMNYLDRIVELGYPVVLGTSRKRFIRTTLDLPPDEVTEGTAATVVAGVLQGCQIMRVHDIQSMKRAAVMADAIVKYR